VPSSAESEEMTTIWDAIYPWIISGIGGCIGAALLLPTKLGEVLIKFRSDRNLEEFKAQQARELEALRERLNHLGDRGKRANELEFNAIAAVWEKFIEAYTATDAAIISFVQIPDLNTMNGDERDKYLETTELSPSQKEQVRSSADPTDMLSKNLIWRQIATAGEQIFLAHKAIRRERIFLPEDLRLEFMRMLDIVSGAYTQRKIEHQSPRRSHELQATAKFYEQGPKGVDNLAAMVRTKLIRAVSESST
jgi:hypothetical protein